MAKTYINVAYKDRDMAKRLGARWDASVRRWYCPPGSPLAKIYSWRKPSVSSARPVLPNEDLTMSNPSPAFMTDQALHSRPGEQLSFLG